MYAAGQRDMQAMDKYTIEEIGLPGVVLMENAGAKVVEEIVTTVPSKHSKVLILCGGGNNGGDGFVIARRLFDLGFSPSLFLLANPEKINSDAHVHFRAFQNRGMSHKVWDEEQFALQLNNADIIIDALLGTGVKGEVREPIRTAIEMVNRRQGNSLVISVDIPSGLNSDDGKAEGPAIIADKTITFVFPKKGFFLQDGPLHVGNWKAVDISVPPSIVNDLGLRLPKVITGELVKASIPQRRPNGHKGTFGHVLVIGGSRPYVGAPLFSAKAALNSGAGLVTLAFPETIYPSVAAQCPEALLWPLPDQDGHLTEKSIQILSSRINQFDCVAVGPGLSRFNEGTVFIKSLLSILTGQPIVIDADALYFIRDDIPMLRQYNGSVLLTPHPGEMATIGGKSVKQIEENRLGIAQSFALENNVWVLLKGHRPVIATPSGELFINPYGNDALGKGGSGDVLTGVIASFLAQGATPEQALISASYVHARGGEEKAKEQSHYGVMPFDIIQAVKEQLNGVERSTI